MDAGGKVIYARNTEIVTANISAYGTESEPVEDGQRLNVSMRELGTTEVYPQSLQHSPNGRFVTVCGDGEYIIYTALAWRNKAFGTGTSFAWASDSNTYAVQETKTKLKAYRNFKERPGLIKSSGWTIDGIHGGTLLAARGSGFVMFWDWETGAIVRRIEVDATNVSWSASGDLVAITGEDSFYVLRFDRESYQSKVDSGMSIGDEGVEDAFELVAEVSEAVRTCKWVGECFIYTNGSNRLSYLVGDQPNVINHFEQAVYLLGYLPTQNRIFVADKDLNISSYALALTVVEYQTAILQGDLEAAAQMLPSIPNAERNRIARFLEAQDLRELALSVSTDPDHRFELAIALNDLETALELVRAAPEAGSQAKWKSVGDRALAAWQMGLAQEAFEKAGDLPALLLLFTSISDRSGLERLATQAQEKGQNNIAFAAYLQLGNAAQCVDLLVSTGRLPEAALFARSYAPQKVGGVVKAWKKGLEQEGRKKIADTIGDPEEDAGLFGEVEAGASGAGAGAGYSVGSTDAANGNGDGEGSGVMVEHEHAADPEGEADGGEGEEHHGTGARIVQQVKDVAAEAEDKVGEVAEKVKGLVVGDGEGEGENGEFGD